MRQSLRHMISLQDIIKKQWCMANFMDVGEW